MIELLESGPMDRGGLAQGRTGDQIVPNEPLWALDSINNSPPQTALYSYCYNPNYWQGQATSPTDNCAQLQMQVRGTELFFLFLLIDIFLLHILFNSQINQNNFGIPLKKILPFQGSFQLIICISSILDEIYFRQQCLASCLETNCQNFL